jgi:exodeoxyribonuclease VII small subunit
MTKESINNSIQKLQTITNWFEEQEEVDVEEGLKKVKEGAILIKDLKGKLTQIENEFEEIKKDLDEE